jgi:Cyclin D1 binding domain
MSLSLVITALLSMTVWESLAPSVAGFVLQTPPRTTTSRLFARRSEESAVRFLQGDDLYTLRQTVLSLRQEYEALPKTSERRQKVQQAIFAAQQADAEFIYESSCKARDKAKKLGMHKEAAHYAQEAWNARSALPQYQLEGLWVGKYGRHGFELVNVTYVGDTLIATKVTGDENVEQGEVSFEVDLSPAKGLQPLELSREAAQPWGSRFLPRFAGQGQVSKKDWLNGQLILVKNYFSFVWLPLQQQVFFGRPSADLVLKLMRRAQNNMSPAAARRHLDQCWEETEFLQNEYDEQESYAASGVYEQEGCFE